MEENKQTEEAKEVKNEQTAETPKKDVASKVTEAVSQIDTDELKKNAASYWNWLVTSWKNPTEVKQTNKYAGLISLALESLFLIVASASMSMRLLRLLQARLQVSLVIRPTNPQAWALVFI